MNENSTNTVPCHYGNNYTPANSIAMRTIPLFKLSQVKCTQNFFFLRDLGQKSCIRAKTIVIKTIMVMSIISELSLCTPHCPFVLFRCMVSSICMAAVGFSFPTIDVLYPVSISSMVPYYQYGVSMES